MARKMVVALACATLVALSPVARASGGDGISYNGFMPETYVPKTEIADFASSNVGVVPSSYWRVYQFLAYRAITGYPLSKADVQLLNINEWRVDNSKKMNHFSYEKSDGVTTWVMARASVKGTVPTKIIDGEVNARNYGSYLNCPADAFNRAAQTLVERQKSEPEAYVKIWLEGQDAVFQNCNSSRFWEQNKNASGTKPTVYLPPSIPSNLLTNVPKWLEYDREYQAAAAHFYAEKYDEARQQFIAIAANKNSPWQPAGAYLAARCLVRKASLNFTGVEGTEVERNAALKTRNVLLDQASAELSTIAKSYPPAEQMKGFVEAQRRPFERMQTIGATLATRKIDASAPQLLTDYIMLLTKNEGGEMLRSTDPMTLWIGLMQAGADKSKYDYDANKAAAQQSEAFVIARNMWHKDKRKTAWLLPLLVNLNPGAGLGTLSDDERDAVASINENMALYQPLQYELARIAIAEKKLNDADDIISNVLIKHQASMGKATRNRWNSLKVITAKTQADFFQALPRVYADTDVPEPISDEPPNETVKNSASTKASNVLWMFDTDYEDRLNHDFSLVDLGLLLKNPNFPSRDKNKSLKETIWARAIALNEFPTAIALADDLAKGRDTTRHLYERLKRAQGDEAKQVAAALILANTPELKTMMPVSYSSGSYRDCRATAAEDSFLCKTPPLNFLTPDAIVAARKERSQLRKWSDGADYIPTTLINWAKQNPNDLEVPKALHFFIVAKRAPTKQSREAFQALHRMYPSSEWAKRTKYYY